MNIWLAEIWRAWRTSLRRPGFLLLASGVLALGVGASAVAFNLIDQVLLKPLPLPQASRLVAVGKLVPRWPPRVSTRQYAALQDLDGVRSIAARFGRFRGPVSAERRRAPRPLTGFRR